MARKKTETAAEAENATAEETTPKKRGRTKVKEAEEETATTENSEEEVEAESAQEGMNIQKKTNGEINIIGEVAESEPKEESETEPGADAGTDEESEAEPSEGEEQPADNGDENETAVAESSEDTPVTEPKKRGRKKKTSSNILTELGSNEDKIFDKRRVHMATKEERQQIYDEEEVFADFGSVAETEKTKRREEYNMFRDAARSVPKTILKGVIGSVTELDGGTLVAYIDQIRRLGRNEEGNTAEGYFQTIIPVSQMIAYDPKQYAGEEGKNELRKKLQRRIGTEIHLCIYDVREKEGIAIGSRLTAEALRVNKWYIKKDEKDGMPKLIEGMLAEATVIEVHNSYLNIEVAGAEGTIQHTELSYNHLSTLYDEYRIGDKINVKIKKITFFDYESDNQKYRLARVETSAKEAQASPADKFFHQFHVGDVCAGVIKSEASETGVFVNLRGKMDCLCPIPASKRATVNSPCGVRITKMDDEQKRIFGEIISI